MKRFAFLGILCALLLSALFFANQQRKQGAAYILSQYPPNARLRRMAEASLLQQPRWLDSAAKINPNELLFYSTWFINDTAHTAMHNVIDASGSYSIVRVEMESGTLQRDWNIDHNKLAPARLSVLKAALRNLPPSQTHPDFANLYILSFNDGYNWQSRVYDKSKLPPEVVAVHKLAVISRMTGTLIEGFNY